MDAKKDNSITTVIRENLYQIMALAVAVLNIWIATKLAPLATDIRLLDTRITAIEKSGPVTSREFEEITKRLDRIEQKIDTNSRN